ncbi:hypothetical protein LF1_36120 [Rubripirellula obstinata]|uniref:Uncharacterized protein n=1 Tax=Rubripirellula obstinata TaxID=406547 RepID=A0A5B1CIZ6_9BACT|nr:hypothetical protein [Rubripirellula obstinata]KAA1261068.1 hypothetical protein LF1_36120 [Rubripirellula obstinata]
MARQIHDREDLFRDGTQMPIRGRTQIDQAEVVVGFRQTIPEGLCGSASLYWDQDPVYQFNSSGELRRVFLNGQRYAAENGVLMRLNQSRNRSSPDQTETPAGRLKLNPIAVADNETSEILAHLHRCLSQLHASLRQSDPPRWQTHGENTEAFCERLADWIGTIEVPCKIASSPAVT